MGDFLTLVQQHLPVKLVVFNSGALGFIEIGQKLSGFLDTLTWLNNPDFAAMAESIGVRGIRLEDPGDVGSGIADALTYDGPVLIDAAVSRMRFSCSAEHYSGHGERLYALHAQGHHGRLRRRTHRSCTDEPVAVVELQFVLTLKKLKKGEQ
jgi:hypothetical protein